MITARTNNPNPRIPHPGNFWVGLSDCPGTWIIAGLYRVTFSLTRCHRFGYKGGCESRSREGRHREGTPDGGASAAPARGKIHSASGRLRASCWPALRPVREVHSLDWDRRARVTPAEQREIFRPRLGEAYWIQRPAASQETWPGVALADRKVQRQEPRWNADRRAHPSGCAPHRKMRRLGNRFAGVPPPLICRKRT